MKIGDKLYYVETFRRTPHGYDVYVTSIGRKWIGVSREPGGSPTRTRLDKATLIADGEGSTSPGRAYLRKEIYDAKVRVFNKWNELRKYFSNVYSASVPEEQIDAIASILSIGTTAKPAVS